MRTLGTTHVLITTICAMCVFALFALPVGADGPQLAERSFVEVSPGAIEAALDADDAKTALGLLAHRTLQIDPQRRSLYEGRACFLAKDYRRARQCLKRATRSRAEASEAYYWLGRTYAAEGAFSLAAGQYREAARLGRRDADLQLHWATALQSAGRLLGQLDQVRLSSNAAEQAKPGDIVDRGVIVRRVGDSNDAFVVAQGDSALYRICLAAKLTPQNGKIQQLVGDVWSSLKQSDQAVAAYARAVEHLENADAIVRCRSAWAKVLLDKGDIEGYLKQCSQLAKLPKTPPGFAMSKCYARAATEAARRGDIQKQIRYLTLASELEADVASLIRLADALVTVQRVSEAQACLDRALERSPSPTQRREIESRRRTRSRTYASPR